MEGHLYLDNLRNSLLHPFSNITPEHPHTIECVPTRLQFGPLLPSTETNSNDPSLVFPQNSFPTLVNVAETFTLNEKQKEAFFVIGEHLTIGYRARKSAQGMYPNLPTTPINDSGLYMYLGGEGGTGKTQIIKALKSYSNAWSFPESIVTLAYTGKAANNCLGTTVHSFFGLSKDSPSLPRVTSQMLNKFAPLQLIILDEISMISQHFLALISSFLQELKNSSLPFGGISMVFSGDFCQLAPIDGCPVYKSQLNSRFSSSVETATNSAPSYSQPGTLEPAKDPKKKNHSVLRATLNYEGYRLWQLVNVSVILLENNRFKHDPEFGQRISRLRLGRTTQADLNAFNSRVISTFVKVPADKLIPYIVISNKLKYGLNIKSLFQHASSLGQTVDCFEGLISLPKKSKQVLTHEMLKNLYQLPPDLTTNLPTHLQVFVGMWVVFTYNIDLKTGLSNGTFGCIVSIIFPSDDVVTCIPINPTVTVK